MLAVIPSKLYVYDIQFNANLLLLDVVFVNGPEHLGSVPGHVIQKSLKMVLDTSLLNTRQYKVSIKGKVEQSRERSSVLPNTLVLKRKPSGCPLLWSSTLLTFRYYLTSVHKKIIYMCRERG